MKVQIFGLGMMLLSLNTVAQLPVDPGVLSRITPGVNKSDIPAGTNLIQKDLAHGNATINIPVYEYGHSGINLGLHLTYNTAGLHVDRIASQIGLGWELQTGGSIEREIRGIPDDIYIAATCHPFGYKAIRGYWINGSSDLSDPEPDVFTALMGNRKVKFMFGRSGEQLILTGPNVKIEKYLNGTPIQGSFPSTTNIDGSTLSFVVTDEQGNKWYYDIGMQTIESREGSVDYGSGPVDCLQTWYPRKAWTLVKVVTYEGQEVTYSYDYSNIDYMTHLVQRFREHVGSNWCAVDKEEPEEKVFQTARLLKIEYPHNIDVQFSYSYDDRCDLPGSKALKEIAVIDRTDPTSAANYTYVFDQGYYVSPNWDQAISGTQNSYSDINTNCASLPHHRFRLRLNKISLRTNKGSSTKLHYEFGYNPMPMPERVYGARDKFGYPTEAVPQQLTNANGTYYPRIPQHTYGGVPVGMNTDISINATYTSAGILNKITNGEKGEIQITYSNNYNGGGLLLNEIKYFDGYNHDNDLIEKYEYSNPDKLAEDFELYVLEYGNFNTWDNYYIWLNTACLANRTMNGYGFVYRTVTEHIRDKNNTQLKKNIFGFSGFNTSSNINNGTGDNLVQSGGNFKTPPFALKQFLREWAIGLPISVERFDHNNQKLSSEIYKYDVSENIENGSDDFKGVAKMPKKLNASNVAEAYYEDTYYPFTGRTSLTEKKLHSYVSSNAYNEVVTTYQYDTEGKLEHETFVNSRNEPVRKSYYYNYHWSNNTSGVSAIDKMNDDKIERLLFTQTFRNDKLVSSTVPGYLVISGNVIRPYNTYELAASAPVPNNALTLNLAAVISGSPLANYRKAKISGLYDNKGHAREEHDGTNSKHAAFIWDNVLDVPLAKAINARYDDIVYCGFETDYKSTGNDIIQWGNLVFKNGGIISGDHLLGRKGYHLVSGTVNTGMWTEPGALTLNKEYFMSVWVKEGADDLNIHTSNQYNGTILEINSNGPSVQPMDSYTINSGGVSTEWHLYKVKFKITQAQNETHNVGIWAHDAYIDEFRIYPVEAEMETVNITPLLGKTSEVDANERIVTYEYDAFNRLSVVKDLDGNIITKTEYVTQGND